ncbi:hypothetical protein DFH06DRAFT_1373717 [Mycena polygramma]|nr:hypothetical protein DFH06DRAFT_1373717 [Mycena polygramma]
MEATMSTSADTIRTLHGHTRQPSPPHSPFQSPPDSPSLSASGSSVSSFPSASSSFFFSSAAASPPHGPAPPPVDEALIIPSLTLPALLMRPQRPQGPLTRLLVLGPPDVATAALFADNPDARDPGAWVCEDGFRVLRTSTAWRDHRDGIDDYDDSNADACGTERSNVELVALGEDVQQLDIRAIENRILAPFRGLSSLLAPPLLSAAHEEDLLTALLTGPEVPLYTALLVVLPPAPPTTSDSSAPPSTGDADASASVSSLSASASTSTSTSALDSLAMGCTLPPLAPTPNHVDAATFQTHMYTETDIPDRLRRLVPVLVLASPAHPSRSRSHSRASTDADTDEDADPNDSTLPIVPPLEREAAATVEAGVDIEASGDTDPDTDAEPLTARLPWKRPRHAARERTETYARREVAAVPHLPSHPHPNPAPNAHHTRTNTHTHTHPHLHTHPHPHPTTNSNTQAHTPSSLRHALRPPAVRALRADAAGRFVRWWRAGGVDPYFEAQRERYDAPRVAVHVEKAHAHSPYTHPYTHAHTDPLHLPSLLALVKDVVRAWASSASTSTSTSSSSSTGTRRGRGSARGSANVRGERERERQSANGRARWWGWGFVAGVVLGVGVGVWVGASG